MDAILRMEGISKYFPGVQALSDVQLEVYPGKVHALIGENGAGKSTLMKVLTGIYKPEEGTITFKGAPYHPIDPKDAQTKGISIIHQEFNLLPDLTVAENVFVTHEPRLLGGRFLINDKKMYRDAAEMIERIGVDLDPYACVSDLSVAQKQMVEIVKALVVKSDVLVLDEPTSALAENEVEKLFQIIRDLREQGVAIIYISHRLEEFDKIVDTVTVLRDGAYVTTKEWADTGIDELIRFMVGRDLDNQYPRHSAKPGAVVLETKNLCRGNKVQNISLKVRRGEILGLAGLMGAGRSELGRAIFGADHIDSGIIDIDGEEFVPHSPSDSITKGIVYLPEDRKVEGLFLDQSVEFNILSASLTDNARAGVIKDAVCKEHTDATIRNLGVKTPSSRQIIKYLSGGNQQKVLIGRWLLKNAKVVIFDEPTRGIDVGAKYEVYCLINQLAESGIAVVIISSDMQEVLGMSDRILVLSEGKSMGELLREDATQERVLQMASGFHI